jgi:phage terminase small subunit
MARPRKPTAVLELTGAFKKDPQRARNDEPVPTGKPGDPPDYLGEVAAGIWHEMVLHGFWLTDADKFLLEIAARHMADFRRGVCDPKIIAQLITVLNKLGFGPAERSKIKAPGAKEDGPKDFDEFK